MEEDIDNELDDIIKINHDVSDINQLMNIMSDEVDKCQETITIIDDAVEQADKNVAKATNDIKATRKVQKSKNKWLWIGLLAVAVVAVVLILVFCL